ncbi:MAG: hypothetical protein ABEJ60_05195 [Halodesulfurarchaeum sp.]
MVVKKVACPYCGGTTAMTVTGDISDYGVLRDKSEIPRSAAGTAVACSECGEQFVGWYE